MRSKLEEQINSLNDAQTYHVTLVLAGELKQVALQTYQSDPDTHNELERLDEKSANRLLEESVHSQLDLTKTADRLRKLLVRLAERPEYEKYLRDALEHRHVSALPDPNTVLLGVLVIMILSVKFKIKFQKSGKETKLDFEASKEATPLAVIRVLLGDLGLLKSVADDESKPKKRH